MADKLCVCVREREKGGSESEWGIFYNRDTENVCVYSDAYVHV